MLGLTGRIIVPITPKGQLEQQQDTPRPAPGLHYRHMSSVVATFQLRCSTMIRPAGAASPRLRDPPQLQTAPGVGLTLRFICGPRIRPSATTDS